MTLPATSDYPVLWSIDTRWADNDHYGHVNNVVYYSYFDTAVNAWLMHATHEDIRHLPAIGIVAETSCRYHAELSFPDRIQVGIGCDRLGSRSITYRLAIFRVAGADLIPAASGRFVHVYVDPATRKPVPIPAAIREAVAAQLAN